MRISIRRITFIIIIQILKTYVVILHLNKSQCNTEEFQIMNCKDAYKSFLWKWRWNPKHVYALAYNSCLRFSLNLPAIPLTLTNHKQFHFPAYDYLEAYWMAYNSLEDDVIIKSGRILLEHSERNVSAFIITVLRAISI